MSLAPSTLDPADIVSRIEAAITNASWHPSHHAYLDFPPGKDSADVLDRSFAVGVIGTTFLEGRQRASVGAHAVTTVGVRFLADVQADDKRGSYTRFLGLETELQARVWAVNRDPDLELRLDAVERDGLSEATLQGDLRYLVRHMYPLT